eukprot:gb/GFBE01002594.1/.p1 GENE.gb/GFBE01002594.1/~~gb/GFBE01002594.1/.p1  ORF type:complete len:174 (+),score=23.97 gb/GFBE01002594.1/:1-522(+)
MGCGAINGQRYEVKALNNLEDDKPKAKPLATSDRGRTQENNPPANGGNVQAAEKPNRYRPGPAMDGVEVTSVEGDSDLARAVAAANDENLLQKYAQFSSEGKKRPGATKRVFAPSNGPLSGEPLRINRVADSTYEQGELIMASNKVGGLRLQHHLSAEASGASVGHGQAVICR